eukprot:gene25374-20473_t
MPGVPGVPGAGRGGDATPDAAPIPPHPHVAIAFVADGDDARAR